MQMHFCTQTYRIIKCAYGDSKKRYYIIQLIYENELNFTKKCGCWFLNHVCSLAMQCLRGFFSTHTPRLQILGKM